MEINIGDLVRFNQKTDKAVSFFESDTTIGKVVDFDGGKWHIKVVDTIHVVDFEDIIAKVEKLSKSKHMRSN